MKNLFVVEYSTINHHYYYYCYYLLSIFILASACQLINLILGRNMQRKMFVNIACYVNTFKSKLPVFNISHDLFLNGVQDCFKDFPYGFLFSYVFLFFFAMKL